MIKFSIRSGQSKSQSQKKGQPSSSQGSYRNTSELGPLTVNATGLSVQELETLRKEQTIKRDKIRKAKNQRSYYDRYAYAF